MQNEKKPENNRTEVKGEKYHRFQGNLENL